MAKLFINKDIVADTEKMENWSLTGVDGMSFSDVQDFLGWIAPDDNHIDIELHSCGGDVAEGYAIYDALRATGKEISATVVGRCASMATVILLAAPIERRKMYPHAKILIHSPYCPGVEGSLDISALESLKAGLEAERERMISIYVERCGVDRAVIEEQMAKESLDTYYDELGKTLGEALLAPTRIYVKAMKSVKNAGVKVKGCSHITGGGFYENIPRMLPDGIRAVVKKDSYEVPAIFRLMQKKGNITDEMMYNTYNMGLGMVLALDPADVDKTMEALKAAGETAYVVGTCEAGEKGVTIC